MNRRIPIGEKILKCCNVISDGHKLCQGHGKLFLNKHVNISSNLYFLLIKKIQPVVRSYMIETLIKATLGFIRISYN